MKKELKPQEMIYQVKLTLDDPRKDKEIKDLIAKLLKEVAPDAKVEYDPNNMSLATDFYELTMGQVNYNNNEENKLESFDLFFRTEPVDTGYGIMAGLEEIIDYIKHLHFTDEDIDYLRSLNKFDEKYLNYLRDFQFSGDLYAVPDGTPVFRNEPLVTVVAPAIECKIIETVMLSIISGAISYATSASNIVHAAGDRPVMEFGFRRSYGPHAGMMVSKYAVMGGCSGTSNTKSAKENGTKALGTSAHASVMEAKNEKEAFRKYAETYPDKPLFLVDTYNTIEGIKNAIDTCKEMGIELGGIRIDSGDLGEQSKIARKMMDEAGFPNAIICLTNSLTAKKITTLNSLEADYQQIGSGDSLAAYEKRVGPVYKLNSVEEDGKLQPRLKVSGDKIKTTNPGFKKTYRFFDRETGEALGDIIALGDEVLPENQYTFVNELNPKDKMTVTNYDVVPLQKQIFRKGELVYDMPSLLERKEYCTGEKQKLAEGVKRAENPDLYRVNLSEKLRELKEELIRMSRPEEEIPIQYQKKTGK